MPPLPRLRIAALEDLARQLRFAPPAALRRQVERAESLAAELDPSLNYPEDWLVHRLTGYRAQIDSPALFVGRALLAELSALIERLSDVARLPSADHVLPAWLSTADLAERWRVSRKSIDRYRKVGLVARRVREADGKARLAFALAAVERFERSQADRLARAGGFSRLGEALEATILRRARAYASVGYTLNQAAARLARRHGRAPETIRQLLLRNESRSPLFVRRGPPSRRERRLVERAWFAGIEPAEVAERLGRSRAAVNRMAAQARADRLRDALLPRSDGGVSHEAEVLRVSGSRGDGADPSADLSPLPPGIVLGVPGASTIGEFLESTAATSAMPAAIERALARRMNGHVARARAVARAAAPSASALDCAETDLRAAAHIKAELVRAQLPLLVRTLAGSLARPMAQQRTADVIRWVLDGIEAIAGAIETFDPSGPGRLAAPVNLALARRLSRSGVLADAGRAAPRLDPAASIPDWTRRIAPWHSWHGRAWLEPSARVRAGAVAIEPRLREVLEWRLGWSASQTQGGVEPMTIAEIAAILKTTVIKATMLERRARREAWRAAR
ncbi:MAG: hypothetical protein ACKVW3_18240 [Phycisphaerales bacterium]